MTSISDESRVPNFVVIFTDDLGINQLDLENPDLVGYQGRGHTITTPNLAQYFGHEGMTFQHWYSGHAVCSPSRAALLTGRQPVRLGIGIGDSGRERVFSRISTGGLPLNETTTATALKKAGYSTALVGKWHLGIGKFHPTNHGFDSFYGVLNSHDTGRSFWIPSTEHGALALYNGSQLIEQSVDLSTIGLRFAAVAGDYIKTQAAQGNPFYLYMPMLHPHTPFRSAVEFCNISSEGAVGDDLWEMDVMVGQVIEAIAEAGVEDNTLVFFTSDNGSPLPKDPLGNLPLFKGKGSPWEGGMRVPAMARWPGTIPGGEVSHALTSTMDIHITLLSLAGVPLESDRVYDGVDLSPLILRESAESVDAFLENNTKRCVMFLINARPGVEYVNAVRCGDYKGHFVLKSPMSSLTSIPYEQRPQAGDNREFPVLVNVVENPGEDALIPNTTAEYDPRVAQMRSAIAEFVDSLDPNVLNQNGLPKNESLDPCSSLPKSFEVDECTLNPEFWAPAHVCESDACLVTNSQFASRCKNNAI